jgi:hypothetical protein
MRRFILLLAVVLTTTNIFAQKGVTKRSVLYATHEGQELYMDIYTAESAGAEVDASPRPLMIFAFGGGFVGGARDVEFYTPYFERLAREGIVVASIDYRLGLRDLPEDIGLRGMIEAMKRAVDIATEDMYAATNYFLNNSEEWNIDRDKVMLSGSSAGAITAVTAEWQRCNGAPLASVLPKDFRYAAVVSCAGAIFSVNGSPKFKSAPAPMLLFHGTSDSNVPYNKASVFGIGFYGSKYITRQLNKLDSPYWFYSAEYVDHSLAGTPLYEQLDLIMQFIQDYVIEGKRLRIVTEVESIDGERRPTNFSVKDYLRANYGK